MRRVLRALGVLLILTAAVSCTEPSGADDAKSGELLRHAEPPPYERILPAPAAVRPGGAGYRLVPGTVIRTGTGSEEVRQIGERLAEQLRGPSGLPLPVVDGGAGDGILLRLDESAAELAEEGYRLESTAAAVTLTARTPAGLFYAGQTLRQLVPASGAGEVPGGTVADRPRFAYRGAMIDIARHYFTVPQVKRYLDQLAQYKINKLHVHLTDDQGWRLAVDSWPRLAEYGGVGGVGGGPGGHWTKDDYRELVEYAAERYVEVVPEIDMPGHTNAALASYPELNCDGKAPDRYTGIKVGFSSLCVSKEVTYEFVEDVLRELAALTPGRYLHIGGDEAHATPAADYAAFMKRAQEAVAGQGKTVVAWHQLAAAEPAPGAVLQWWGHDKTPAAERDRVAAAAKAGHRLILSPADRAYLDMKYDKDTALGLAWAGHVPVRRSYAWDPGTHLAGVPESAVLGVEAPLWTETIATRADLELMAFPRVLGIAELGWSPAAKLDWAAYSQRLASHGPRLTAQDIGYFRAPDVPWP
ncbi:beta-N-acetylhexosaminidase [Streptomyces venezuelae]|uniref:beta-N-acetylhexosaminidase n=1 Tax=Streptomyces venezuelae TaxID=54571 RepID=A0A5P2CZP9_STRVZ|nr:beta-N-acetylhexosaminidase [Streptomyces venezuelae]QES48374.1 beta-N-acetylhexosaminidase [Streptomyces venezuelae]